MEKQVQHILHNVGRVVELEAPQEECTNWGPAPLGKERRSQGCTAEQWRCHSGDCVKAEYR